MANLTSYPNVYQSSTNYTGTTSIQYNHNHYQPNPKKQNY